MGQVVALQSYDVRNPPPSPLNGGGGGGGGSCCKGLTAGKKQERAT